MGEFTRLSAMAPIALRDYAQFYFGPDQLQPRGPVFEFFQWLKTLKTSRKSAVRLLPRNSDGGKMLSSSSHCSSDKGVMPDES
jgi:hypothetical protein